MLVLAFELELVVFVVVVVVVLVAGLATGVVLDLLLGTAVVLTVLKLEVILGFDLDLVSTGFKDGVVVKLGLILLVVVVVVLVVEAVATIGFLSTEVVAGLAAVVVDDGEVLGFVLLVVVVVVLVLVADLELSNFLESSAFLVSSDFLVASFDFLPKLNNELNIEAKEGFEVLVDFELAVELEDVEDAAADALANLATVFVFELGTAVVVANFTFVLVLAGLMFEVVLVADLIALELMFEFKFNWLFILLLNWVSIFLFLYLLYKATDNTIISANNTTANAA